MIVDTEECAIYFRQHCCYITENCLLFVQFVQTVFCCVVCYKLWSGRYESGIRMAWSFTRTLVNCLLFSLCLIEHVELSADQKLSENCTVQVNGGIINLKPLSSPENLRWDMIRILDIRCIRAIFALNLTVTRQIQVRKWEERGHWIIYPQYYTTQLLTYYRRWHPDTDLCTRFSGFCTMLCLS